MQPDLEPICAAFWEGARNGFTGNDLFRFVWDKFPDAPHAIVLRASFRAAVFNGHGSSDELLAIYDAAIKNRALARLIGGDEIEDS
jgi:hypothetical protein